MSSPARSNYALHRRFYPNKKKKDKPKIIKMHDVTGHVIIQDSDVATPVKKVGLVQSFVKKTSAKFRCSIKLE
jgi:hypothetical protein